MSDKLISPASSNSGGFPTPRKQGNGDEPFLVVQRQPPTHVFTGEPFEVDLSIETPKSQSLMDADVEVTASLWKNGRFCPGLDLRSPPILSKNKCTLRCTVHVNDISREKGAVYSIRIEAPRITAVCTSSIHVVNYKIKVTPEDDWENIWYKDEGGRDKCMEVYAAIYDRENKILRESIPLQITLFYETDQEPVQVTNQSILRSLGGTKLQTEKATGRARIRFRIEDVSKNHQGQDFTLQIACHKGKGYRDIGPGYAPAVSVRSKRNKRQRSISRSASIERRASPQAARPRASVFDETREPFEGADIVRLRDAMKGVIHWTEEVVNGLYPLQWQILGYAQNPDGSPDFSRPYHSMPNPNACISRVLSMYSDSTREHLRVLLNAVEKTGPTRPEYGSIPSFSMPREPEDVAYGSFSHAAGMPGSRRPVLVTGPDVYPKSEHALARYPPPPPPMQHPPMPYMRHPIEGEAMHPAAMPPMRVMPMGDEKPPPRGYEEPSEESEVEFVLAKQYKALRTGERLGFPAYNRNKEMLGFYRESSSKVGVGQFIPISRHRDEFGPLEIMQATEILEEAIRNKSEAVHALKDWGSISNLIDHALVYDWSKDIGGSGSNNSSAG